MVPRDFVDSGLTDNELRVAVGLLRHTHSERPVWEGQLVQLERLCGWAKSRPTMLRTIRSLKAKGWVDYDVEERQRGPWRIELTGLSMVDCVTTASPGAHSMTQSSASPSSSPSASNDGAVRDSGAARLRQETASPPSTSKGSTKEDHLLGEGTRESGAVSFSLEGLTAEVREAVRRTRDGGLPEGEIEFLGSASLGEIADRYRGEEQ